MGWPRRSLIVFALVACGAPSPSSKTTPTKSVVANRIVNLYDAFGDVEGTTKDWGYAAIVEYEGHTILFDSGRNADTFAKNAAALSADLKRVEIAVLSHDHMDHYAGLYHLLEVNPRLKLYLPDDGNLGAQHVLKQYPPSTGRFWKADVAYVDAPREVLPGVTLVPTTSPYLGRYDRYPPNDKNPEMDGLPEVSMSLRTPKGEVIVVGCSHSGVENIVEATKKHTKREVELVVGGFHMLPYTPERVSGFVKQMKDDLRVHRVAPAHCTGETAMKLFKEAYGDKCTPAGLGSTVLF